MVEPITCVPSAVLTMPAATPAAEPLLDPPGVRRRSCGLRVPRGSVEANSVVTVFPTMTAPASRSAATLAPSRSERKPANSGEPFSVGMSAVSMMSLMPIGMPSIFERGRPARQRAVDWSAAARAPSRLRLTKAPILGSSAATPASGHPLPDSVPRPHFPADRGAPVKLTAKAVAALTLPAGKTDVIHFDDAMPGFGYRVRLGASGKVLRTWVVQYRRAGGTRRVLLGNAEVVGAEQARVQAPKVLGAGAMGQDPQADRASRRDKDQNSFRALAEDFLAAKARQLRPHNFT